MLTAGEDDWLAVVGNPGKARKSWGWLCRVLGREGSDPKVLGNFYKMAAQAVLIFGAETWVLTKRTEKALDSFQSRVARRLTGNQPWRKKDGIWDYPPLAEALRKAELEGIRKYITQRAEHGHTIYCDTTDSGPMQAGHSADRRAGVLALVGAGRNRPGEGEETGGGVNDKIGDGDGVGGGVVQGTERGSSL